MTNEEAKKTIYMAYLIAFARRTDFINYKKNAVDIAFPIAIEALEKQIPKKPRGTICPTCRGVSIMDDEYGFEYNYCPNCGQAIDWSENDKY